MAETSTWTGLFSSLINFEIVPHPQGRMVVEFPLMVDHTTRYEGPIIIQNVDMFHNVYDYEIKLAMLPTNETIYNSVGIYNFPVMYMTMGGEYVNIIIGEFSEEYITGIYFNCKPIFGHFILKRE